MMNDEKSKKAKAITMLFGSFGQSNDAERMAIYVEMLNDIPADVLDKVCKKAILECKFLPSVAELVQSARNFIGDMTGNSTPTWEEAWKEIEHEMQTTFVYGTPQFSHMEIKQAVDAFGWQELCSVLTKDLPIVRAQLRDMYNNICAENRKKEINRHVIGMATLIDDGKNIRLVVQ